MRLSRILVVCRWVLPDQCVCQPVSDPESGAGPPVLRLPDSGGPGRSEGVELQEEPGRPEAEGEPAEPGTLPDVPVIILS